MKQKTEEWHNFRRQHVGASESGIIWKETPSGWYRLWEEKMGLSENTFINEAMQRGIELEPMARAWFNKKFNTVVWPDVKESEGSPFLSASADGLSLDGKVLAEFKCPTSRAILDQAQSGEFYLDHFCQLQQQMYVYGLKKAYYVIYFSDDDAHVFEVEYSKKWFDEYIEKAKRFWYYVEKKIPPLDERDDPEFAEIEERIVAILEEERRLKDELKAVQEEKEFCLEAAKSITGEKSAMGRKTFFLKSKRKGTVDYSSIPGLKSIDLEQYRKPDIVSWKFTLRKEQE